MIEFTIQHRRERLERLYRALAALGVGRLRRGAWVVAVACVFGMVITSSLAWPWVAVAAIALTIAVGLDVLVQQQITSALGLLDAIGPQGLHYRVDDGSLSETSVLTEVRMPWTSFVGQREVAGHLVLDRIPAGAGLFVALPLDQLPAEARATIDARVRAAAGPARA